MAGVCIPEEEDAMLSEMKGGHMIKISEIGQTHHRLNGFDNLRPDLHFDYHVIYSHFLLTFHTAPDM